MNIELLKVLAQWVGVPLLFLIAGALLLTIYPQLKTLLGDLLRAVGWMAKWLRRASMQSEIEGTLSLFSKKYNGELTTPFLPQCDVRWVTDKNVEAIWESGKLIVKVSFGEDHDKNFLAATTAFVKAGLLPRAKSFLSQTTAEAVDLFLTRTILVDSRRSALKLFNDKFREIGDVCRETYFKVEEIEAKRLFRRVLLQEYYFFGESVLESVPRPEHTAEADDFLDWLYDLAMREQDELSELAFKGKYITVGVILVAREETYRQFGISPYLRRANKYAAEHFQTIYLLSRGSLRSRITKEIASQLAASGNFIELTDSPDLVVSSQGAREVITIIPLKPDLAAITQSAWEKMGEAQRTNQEVTVIVQSVGRDLVAVSAFGLLVEIPLAELSDLQVFDARRYFREFQELEVRVLEIDPGGNILKLSNRLTRTDPKRIVDELKEALEDGAEATVVGYRDVDGYEVGLQVQLEGGMAQGFVPRSKAVFSRFIVLSQKYPRGSQVHIKVIEFDLRYNSFLCEVVGRPDPWAEINRYRVGENYAASLRQISERALIYELEEGVEGVVFVEEVAWESVERNVEIVKAKAVGEQGTVQVLRVNAQHRQLRLSLKRVQESPKQGYYRAHNQSVVEIEVVELLARGVRVRVAQDGVEGWIPIYELSWVYCSDPTLRLSESRCAKARIIGYNPAYDNLILSLKQVLPNQFEEYKSKVSGGDEVRGTVVCQLGGSTEVSLSLDDGTTCAGYIHKSQVSNVAYVTDADLPSFLPQGVCFPFTVWRFDERNRIVELSRKIFLREALRELEYGESYSVRIAQRGPRGVLVYGERLEGLLAASSGTQTAGQEISVLVARLGSEPKDLELTRPLT